MLSLGNDPGPSEGRQILLCWGASSSCLAKVIVDNRLVTHRIGESYCGRCPSSTSLRVSTGPHNWRDQMRAGGWGEREREGKVKIKGKIKEKKKMREEVDGESTEKTLRT